jgi:polyhydroxybutyrate depolymerase
MKKGFKMGLALVFVAAAVALVALYACNPPSPSSTCNTTLKPGDDLKCSVDGRTFYLYAPKNYNASQPTALIVDAHGAAESASAHAGLGDEYCTPGTPSLCFPAYGSGWRKEAEMPGAGFIVITPQGRNNIWSPSDEDFILNAVAQVKRIANIDPKKVYISGISNGGLLSYWVGCPNTDVFSGLAPVSGGSDCDSLGKALPVITFDAQPDFAYQTSVSASDTMVDLNNCRSGPTTWLTVDKNYTEAACYDDPYSNNPKLVPCSSITPAIQPTVCKRWYNCDRGVEVVFCDVAPGNSHGAGNEATDAHVLYYNASHLSLPSLAWRFFKSMPDGGSSSSSSSSSSGGCR